MNEQRKSKPMQGQLLDMPADSYAPPNLRVNCATLARMFNVSRTTIKRYVDDGKIQLDDNMLACPKQAAKSVLESATAGRAKAKFFKTQIDQTSALQNEIARLNARVVELESALTEITTVRDGWICDYWQSKKNVDKFIEQLTTDEDLKTTVNTGNAEFLTDRLDYITFDDPAPAEQETHETEN